MQVTEIAKLAEKTKEEVADALGVAKEGSYWFAQVDDTVAQEYIMAQCDTDTPPEQESPSQGLSASPVVEPELVARKRAQFWSSKRSHFLSNGDARNTQARGDVQFKDWRYITDDDGAEATFLRTVDIRDRIGIREVINEPYDKVNVGVAFQLYLESLIYTGNTKADGPSREGVRCVAAMLSAEDESNMEPIERNSPKQLIAAVVARKSMNVQSF